MGPEFEFMPDPQFNHECPTCGTFESVLEHSTEHYRWRTCGHCGECEGVLTRPILVPIRSEEPEHG